MAMRVPPVRSGTMAAGDQKETGMQRMAADEGADRSRDSAWRSPWVIGWIALVMVVLLVNMVMVWLAVHSSPGLVAEDYYERGRDYAIDRAAREAAWPQGWQVRLDAPTPLSVGQPARFHVAAIDARGVPVVADRAELFAYRPSDAAADFRVVLIEEAPGVYGAEASFPLVGLWDLIVQLESGGQLYDIARRIRVAGD